MEMGLEEFRKRLLNPRPLARTSEPARSRTGRGATSARDEKCELREPIGRASAAQTGLPLETARLRAAFASVESAGKAMAESAEAIAALTEELSRVAASFRGVRGFIEQVGVASAGYSAMKPLHQELTRFERTFSNRFVELVESVKSTGPLRGRIRAIAAQLKVLAGFEEKSRALATLFTP